MAVANSGEERKVICYSDLLVRIIRKAASAAIINQLINICKYIIIIIIIIIIINANVYIIDGVHLSSQRLVFPTTERHVTDCGGRQRAVTYGQVQSGRMLRSIDAGNWQVTTAELQTAPEHGAGVTQIQRQIAECSRQRQNICKLTDIHWYHLQLPSKVGLHHPYLT